MSDRERAGREHQGEAGAEPTAGREAGWAGAPEEAGDAASAARVRGRRPGAPGQAASAARTQERRSAAPEEAGDAASAARVRKALEDFPIRSSEEDAVTRREFVRYLALGSGGLALGTTGLAALTSVREPATREPMEVVALDDVEVGGTHLFTYPTGDDPAILLRPTPEDVLAFSQRCTHLACVVYYDHDDGELVCPCHNGHFDAADGAVLAGPPERPLNAIDLEIRDGMVWAVGGGGH